MTMFRPNLAAKTKKNQTYEALITRMLDKNNPEWLFASPKLDGIRCIMHMKLGPVSRTLKEIPNRHLRAHVKKYWEHYKYLDGEFVWGDHTSSDYSFQKTFSKWSSHDDEDISQMYFHAFDSIYRCNDPFQIRQEVAQYIVHEAPSEARIRTVEQRQVKGTLDAIFYAEEDFLTKNYEGAMLRLRDCPYKMGRSTELEGGLVALKRFEDTEGIIIGFEELMHNDNEATTNALGYTVRSSHAGNKVPGGTLGKIILKPSPSCLYFGGSDITFKCGSGLDAKMRQDLWDAGIDAYRGRMVTYKFQNVGIKDKPRAPIFKAIRPSNDVA